MENWKQGTATEGGIHKWSHNDSQELPLELKSPHPLYARPLNQKVLSCEVTTPLVVWNCVSALLCTALWTYLFTSFSGGEHSATPALSNVIPLLSQAGGFLFCLFGFFSSQLKHFAHSCAFHLPTTEGSGRPESIFTFCKSSFLFPNSSLGGASTGQRGWVKLLQIKYQRIKLNRNVCSQC